MSGETEEAADTIAQMRQLAAQDPDAAQRLAAELMAALNRAGVTVDGAPIDAPETPVIDASPK